MGTRRIERPRYGMVVTDGIAGRVFVLLCPAYPDSRGDDTFVWDVVQVEGPIGALPGVALRGRVFLAPGEFAEVVEDDVAAAAEYEFVGGPLAGREISTGGCQFWRAMLPMPPLAAAFDDDDLSSVAHVPKTVDYELRRDGRYHLVGSA